MSAVFDRDTSCRKLFPEPFATPLLGLAGMTKLPLHYLGESLACPLARLGSAEDPYNLIPLQDKPKLRISAILWLGDIAYVENGLGVYIILQSKLFDAICETIVSANHLGRGFGCAKNNVLV